MIYPRQSILYAKIHIFSHELYMHTKNIGNMKYLNTIAFYLVKFSGTENSYKNHSIAHYSTNI